VSSRLARAGALTAARGTRAHGTRTPTAVQSRYSCQLIGDDGCVSPRSGNALRGIAGVERLGRTNGRERRQRRRSARPIQRTERRRPTSPAARRSCRAGTQGQTCARTSCGSAQPYCGGADSRLWDERREDNSQAPHRTRSRPFALRRTCGRTPTRGRQTATQAAARSTPVHPKRDDTEGRSWLKTHST